MRYTKPLLLVMFVLAFVLSALLVVPNKVTQAAPGCAGGLVNDDGSPDSGIGATGDNVVQQFALPGTPFDIGQVCFCFSRTGVAPDLNFNITIFDDTGSGPGGLLGSFGVTATAVPIYPAGAVYDFPLTFNTTSSSVYIGASWNGVPGEEFFVCRDDNPATAQQIAYYSAMPGGPWNSIEAGVPIFQAMMIRAEGVITPPPGGTGSSSSATSLPDDGRENTLARYPWQTAAIYCTAYGIDVYRVYANSVGVLAFRVTPDEIEALGIPVHGSSPEDMRLAEGLDVALYRLPTGEFQVNAPQEYVFIWDGCG